MKRIGYKSLALLATFVFVGVASAATPNPNGIVSVARLWNDYPQATCVWVDNYPAHVEWQFNCPFALTGWANKGYFELSGDGGATKLLFPNLSNYSYEADFTLTGTNVGHLEGGIAVQPWWTDDGDEFMCNIGSGEITEWGGFIPSFSFSNTFALHYNLGTLIHEKVVYLAGNAEPTQANPATVELSIVYGGLPYTSGPIACGASNPNDPPHGSYGQLNDTKLGGVVMGGPVMGDPNGGAGTLSGTFNNILFQNLDGPTPTRSTSWGAMKALYR